MGEALYELEEVLRSKKVNLTTQEVNLLMACKAKAVRAFTVGAGAGGGVAWLGIAVGIGLYRFGKSFDPCIEHILNQEGSRMQLNVDATSNDSNPFDCVFGIPPIVEEINRPASSTTSPRRQSRSQKRFHCRQRMHKRKASSTSEHEDSAPIWHVNL